MSGLQLDDASQKDLYAKFETRLKAYDQLLKRFGNRRQSFLEGEKAQARQRQTVLKMNDECFTKCVSKINTKYSRGEESCLMNCVDRFIDSSVHIVKQLEQLSSPGAGH